MNTNNSNLFVNGLGNYYNNGNNIHFSSNNNNNQTTSPLKHAPNIPLLQAKKYANEYKNSSELFVFLFLKFCVTKTYIFFFFYLSAFWL